MKGRKDSSTDRITGLRAVAHAYKYFDVSLEVRNLVLRNDGFHFVQRGQEHALRAPWPRDDPCQVCALGSVACNDRLEVDRELPCLLGDGSSKLSPVGVIES